MSVERIKNTIIGEAEAEAEKLVEQAQSEKEDKLTKGRSKIDSDFQRRFEQAEKKLKQEAERKVMQKRSQHNLELLKKRNELLNSVFEKAAEHLTNLDDEAYRNMLSEWAQQLPDGIQGEILCNSSDAERLMPLVKDLNKDRDKDAELTLVEDTEVVSGMVFRSQNFELDMTVRSKLNEMREELTPEVAAIIFPPSVKV